MGTSMNALSTSVGGKFNDYDAQLGTMGTSMSALSASVGGKFASVDSKFNDYDKQMIEMRNESKAVVDLLAGGVIAAG